MQSDAEAKTKPALICDYEYPTGTHLRERVCRSPDEVIRLLEQSRGLQSAPAIQTCQKGACGSGD